MTEKEIDKLLIMLDATYKAYCKADDDAIKHDSWMYYGGMFDALEELFSDTLGRELTEQDGKHTLVERDGMKNGTEGDLKDQDDNSEP